MAGEFSSGMPVIRNVLVVAAAAIAWQYYTHNYALKTTRTPQVSGYFHPAFRKVADVFKQNVESGFEQGAAFAVYHKGQPLVDMWGGWADVGAERHWQEDTMSMSFSMVKGVTAMVIARLVDMGLLDYKKEVYHYWPDFGTPNKRNITVEMMFSHQAGLIGLDEKLNVFEYRDNWPKVEKSLAKQSPFWPPGTAVGYHGLTYGFYADAIVRRVDPKNRDVSQFFQEEIARPLDIEFHIGLPKEKFHRFARIQPASFWEFRFRPLDALPLFVSKYAEAMSCWNLQATDFNNPDVLAIGIPSVMGFGPARSLAKLYDYLANNGSIGSKRLLSAEAVQLLQEPLTANIPNLFLMSRPMSRGLFLDEDKQGHKLIGHIGYGGSRSYADLTAGLGVVYSTNYLSLHVFLDPRELSLTEAIFEGWSVYQAEQAGAKRRH